MGKGERRIFTEEFRREAFRLTVTSGRTIVQVANDLRLLQPVGFLQIGDGVVQELPVKGDATTTVRLLIE